MKRLIGSCLLASLALCMHAQPAETGLKIAIHIYNYTRASPEALARAEQEAARIFQRTGIETGWLDCPLTEQQLSWNSSCEVPSTPSRFTIRLLSNTMAERFPLGHDFFGFALLPVRGECFGVTANIFAERAQEMAGSIESRAVILGAVMAHELGHLLLRHATHSVAGIMCGQWRTREIQCALKGTLLFLPEEEKSIRAQVALRMMSGGGPPPSDR
jgi:hypothetical protein